jgi:hypothetical protein
LAIIGFLLYGLSRTIGAPGPSGDVSAAAKIGEKKSLEPFPTLHGECARRHGGLLGKEALAHGIFANSMAKGGNPVNVLYQNDTTQIDGIGNRDGWRDGR